MQNHTWLRLQHLVFILNVCMQALYILQLKLLCQTRLNTFAIIHKAWVANLERIWGFHWVPSC